MKLLYLAPLLVGCLGLEGDEPPETSEVESEVASKEGQGSDYQGSDYQGSDYQGSDYQGSDYQGSDYQGVSYGGVTLGDAASISGTALTVWIPAGKNWEQRSPTRTCYWNSTRTAQVAPCRDVNLTWFASPLVGTTFKGSFVKTMQTVFGPRKVLVTGKIRIDAVRHDTSLAMHPLTGHSTSCGTVPKGQEGCENPKGCRRNCDIFLYTLTLIDYTDGEQRSFCQGGAPATAVGMTYDSTGTATASKTKFTFACTGGTIAKCTRWGYRPFGTARMHCNTPNCGTSFTNVALSPFHQSCVRAAAADYCANGTSFTKNGTLVDIYDYEPDRHDWGFIPRTRDNYLTPDATAFVWESSFDRYGGMSIAHMRFQELANTQNYGDINNPTTGCPNRWFTCGGDDACGTMDYGRNNTFPAWDPNSAVSIDSTPACSHSEHTVGKWLHRDCSACTARVALDPAYAYCNNPTSLKGWDAQCRKYAQDVCPPSARPFSTSHSECEAGEGLKRYATGCTLAVCNTPGYESCCNPGPGNWTAQCASKANTACGTPGFGTPLNGFCTTSFINPPIFEMAQ